MFSWASQTWEKVSQTVAPPPTEALGKYVYCCQQGKEQEAMEAVQEVMMQQPANTVVVNAFKGQGLLHVACEHSLRTLIHYCITQVGCSLQSVDAAGNTPLHCAASALGAQVGGAAVLDIVKMLVMEFQASVLTKNHAGQTPYDVATLNVVRQYLLPLQLQQETQIALDNGGVGLPPGMDLGGLKISNPHLPPPPMGATFGVIPARGVGIEPPPAFHDNNSSVSTNAGPPPSPYATGGGGLRAPPPPQSGPRSSPTSSQPPFARARATSASAAPTSGNAREYARSGYSSAVIYSTATNKFKPDGFHSSSSDKRLQEKYGHAPASGFSSAAPLPPPPSSGNVPAHYPSAPSSLNYSGHASSSLTGGAGGSGHNPFAAGAAAMGGGPVRAANRRYVAYDAATVGPTANRMMMMTRSASTGATTEAAAPGSDSYPAAAAAPGMHLYPPTAPASVPNFATFMPPPIQTSGAAPIFTTFTPGVVATNHAPQPAPAPAMPVPALITASHSSSSGTPMATSPVSSSFPMMMMPPPPFSSTAAAPSPSHMQRYAPPSALSSPIGLTSAQNLFATPSPRDFTSSSSSHPPGQQEPRSPHIPQQDAYQASQQQQHQPGQLRASSDPLAGPTPPPLDAQQAQDMFSVAGGMTTTMAATPNITNQPVAFSMPVSIPAAPSSGNWFGAAAAAAASSAVAASSLFSCAPPPSTATTASVAAARAAKPASVRLPTVDDASQVIDCAHLQQQQEKPMPILNTRSSLEPQSSTSSNVLSPSLGSSTHEIGAPVPVEVEPSEQTSAAIAPATSNPSLSQAALHAKPFGGGGEGRVSAFTPSPQSGNNGVAFPAMSVAATALFSRPPTGISMASATSTSASAAQWFQASTPPTANAAMTPSTNDKNSTTNQAIDSQGDPNTATDQTDAIVVVQEEEEPKEQGGGEDEAEMQDIPLSPVASQQKREMTSKPVTDETAHCPMPPLVVLDTTTVSSELTNPPMSATSALPTAPVVTDASSLFAAIGMPPPPFSSSKKF